MIESLKSKLFLEIKSAKEGSSIIQNKHTGKENQLWHICYVGNNLYEIQSELDRSLYLGVTDKFK